MAFRFQPSDETVESAVRRIACAELDAALAAIRAAERPPGRVVHEVRRRCKALRGLIRLVRPAFPSFAAENAALRDIARQLAGVRDGAVLADTLARLAGSDGAAIASLRTALPPDHADEATARAALDRCVAPLLAARVRAASWAVNADGWDALAAGFTRTIKAARRAMKTFEATADAEAGHEWRKQAKYHWQHMRLLRGVAEDEAGKRAKRVVRLCDLLGERHDLDLLLETLASSRARGDEAEAMMRLVARAHRRIEALDMQAITLGKRLFGGKSRGIADKWAIRWRRWVDSPGSA
ncbi:MAG: hypothetical protein BGP16_07195 [Sphingobium sp. 66-54]|nr:MAG: hypothetical protein BGP16_07195 [Sphingobium sp. 66-54]